MAERDGKGEWVSGMGVKVGEVRGGGEERE